jgi:hypothetical protein
MIINEFKIEWYVELDLRMTLILSEYLYLYYIYIIFVLSKKKMNANGRTSKYGATKRTFKKLF